MIRDMKRNFAFLYVVVCLECLAPANSIIHQEDHHYQKFITHSATKATVKRNEDIGESCNIGAEYKVLKSGSLSDSIKQLLVNLHNKYRRKVAKGEEKNGLTGPQPPAANMMELRWDDELAANAQRWVKQCPDEAHRLPKGRNVYADTKTAIPFLLQSAPTAEASVRKAIQRWYQEASGFSNHYISPFKATKNTTNYSQLVWAKSLKLGCGFFMSKKKDSSGWYTVNTYKRYIVCAYEQRGNVEGFDMYEVGSPASNCPHGTEKNDGLCSPTCPSDKFLCNSGRCIMSKLKCDGIPDCEHKDDEDNCCKRRSKRQISYGSYEWLTYVTPTTPEQDNGTCQDDAFQCSNGHCVPLMWKCDGFFDCSTGEDEENCTTSGNLQFQYDLEALSRQLNESVIESAKIIISYLLNTEEQDLGNVTLDLSGWCNFPNTTDIVVLLNHTMENPPIVTFDFPWINDTALEEVKENIGNQLEEIQKRVRSRLIRMYNKRPLGKQFIRLLWQIPDVFSILASTAETPGKIQEIIADFIDSGFVRFRNISMESYFVTPEGVNITAMNELRAFLSETDTEELIEQLDPDNLTEEKYIKGVAVLFHGMLKGATDVLNSSAWSKLVTLLTNKVDIEDLVLSPPKINLSEVINPKYWNRMWDRLNNVTENIPLRIVSEIISTVKTKLPIFHNENQDFNKLLKVIKMIANTLNNHTEVSIGSTQTLNIQLPKISVLWDVIGSFLHTIRALRYCTGEHMTEVRNETMKKFDRDNSTAITCKSNEFQCSDGKCIPKSWVCDQMKDCEGSDDEKSCTTVSSSATTVNRTDKVCKKNQFQCLDGPCLPQAWRCDGMTDCLFEEDEKDCEADGFTTGQPITTTTATNKTTVKTAEATSPCSGDKFHCGAGQCIPAEWKCDKMIDCQNEDDEKNCVATTIRPAEDTANITACKSKEFSCGDGQCINAEWECDGMIDCQNEMDEKNCAMKNKTTVSTTTPKADALKCQTLCTNGECIATIWTCDGISDCKTGEDEENCTCNLETEFQCDNGTCIPRTSLCNNKSDCVDSTDEMCDETWMAYNKANQPSRTTEVLLPGACNHDTEFQCSDGTCITHMSVCDRKRDCANRSDEDRNMCRQHTKCDCEEFNCDTGQCIPLIWRCNGLKDCFNGDDETNCNISTTSTVRTTSRSPRDGRTEIVISPSDLDIPILHDCIPVAEFTCKDKRCIPALFVCDSYKDCLDSSDEDPAMCGGGPHTLDSKVPEAYSITTPSGPPCNLTSDFICADKSCIPIVFLCDGYKDCADNSDESDNQCKSRDLQEETLPTSSWITLSISNYHVPPPCFPNSEFECEDKNCIPNAFLCDGINDCADKSDEDKKQCNIEKNAILH